MTVTASKIRIVFCGIVCAVWLVPSSSLLAQPPASRIGTDPDVLGAERLFSAWLEGQMLERGLPGAAVGVVADQDLVWATGFGFADTAAKTRMTPATSFRMASHSKLFTATAVMQLREQGKLRLDDPVAKYLPWFKVVPAEAEDPPITIEELLTHSSGLPREAGAHWTTFDFPTRDELRALLPARVAPFAPEVRWKYSNLAYSVAGLIVEAVSGQSYADYIQREIFQPLGMNASSVDKNVSGLAVGYGRRMPDGSGRPIRSSTRVEWPPRTASHRPWRTWPGCRRSSGRARAAERRFSAPDRCARCIASAYSRATGRRATPSDSPCERPAAGPRLARRQLSRLSDQHAVVARREGGRDRPHQRGRWESWGPCDRADEHRGSGRGQSLGQATGCGDVGSVVVAFCRPVIAGVAAIHASSN